MPRLLIENDRPLRTIAVILDPDAAIEQRRALADFFAHDEPDFEGWLARVRNKMPGLFPAELIIAGNRDELRARIRDVDAVIVESLEIGEPELAAAERLRFVQKFGTVTRNIDLSACAARGVPVGTLKRRQNIAVAEHAFALMLALAKRLCELDGNVTVDGLRENGFNPSPFDRRYTSNSNFGRVAGLKTLSGCTVGVIGLGEIGREFAHRASAFGMNVLYHQRSRLGPADEARLNASPCGLVELVERCDFVSLHLPLSAATRGMIDRDVLMNVKPGAVLVNTARAELVEREALLKALDSGRLGGFALDTGYDEPARSDEPLLGRRNIIMTPHTAPASRMNGLMDMEEMCMNLWQGITGARCQEHVGDGRST